MSQPCQRAGSEPDWCIVHEAVYEPSDARSCLPIMRELESPDLASRITRTLTEMSERGELPEDLFRELDPAEAERFRLWAREHHAAGSPISPLWHPVIRAECIVIDREGDTR